MASDSDHLSSATSAAPLHHPSRIVPGRHVRSESQALRTGVKMPSYTIQRDAPWMAARVSAVPTTASSMYSDDEDHGRYNDRENAVAPLHLTTKPTSHSRLPIFQHVRSMLQKPASPMATGNIRWDEYSGEMSETGKAAQVTPSTYTLNQSATTLDPSPTSGFAPPRIRKNQARPEWSPSVRSVSPVSMLREHEVSYVQPATTRSTSPISPVSAIAPGPVLGEGRSDPTSLSREPPTSIPPIRRKPAPLPPNIAPPPTDDPEPASSPSASSDWSEPSASEEEDYGPGDTRPVEPSSHFSWTTGAPSPTQSHSFAPAYMASPPMPSSPTSTYDPGPSTSRFSWTTVATGTTNASSARRPPPVPTVPAMPPIPATMRSPPVQSILSRSRPVERADREEWAPALRKTSDTPRSARTPKHLQIPTPRTASPASSASPSAAKALPPPPSLASPASPLSHLDSLLAQARDLSHQRSNVDKMIRDLTKIEKASPMDVDFSTVRDTRKRLAEYRLRLDEVLLEERAVGIAISRARRNEGEEANFWVRRVTG